MIMPLRLDETIMPGQECTWFYSGKEMLVGTVISLSNENTTVLWHTRRERNWKDNEEAIEKLGEL